jgi:hypothetical protein
MNPCHTLFSTEFIEQLRNRLRAEEQVSVDDNEVILSKILSGRTHGVCGSQLVRLFNICDRAAEPIAVPKVIPHAPASVSDHDTDICDACSYQPFHGPLQERAIADRKHRFRPEVAERIKSLPLPGC